jgi:glycosyltransferase involved in cell wall biosynthesis
VSTFQASRRHDVGVAAFAALHRKLPEARLVLVGDGGLRADTEARVLAAGLSESIRFVGYQSGDAFVRWLQALDAVWILGLGNDFSGRAAAQARACDVRVVAVDEGALASNADAVVSHDPAEIAEATIQLQRAERVRRSNEDIARDVLCLYGLTPTLPSRFKRGGSDP